MSGLNLLTVQNVRLGVLAAASLLALVAPLAATTGKPVAVLAALLLLIVAIGLGMQQHPVVPARWLTAAFAVDAVLLFAGLFRALSAGAQGHAGLGFWAAVVAAWLAAWVVVDGVVAETPDKGPWRTLGTIAAPLVFGATLLLLWECIVRGAGVPPVILPPPSAILSRFFNSLPTLGADFLQTAQGVIAGYVIGCGAGLLGAILTDRLPFLQRGLLPLSNLVSALPIVGIAPIMVMWFGFDWHSKAAVVVIMTFFPMLVNCVAGLASAASHEKDLMRTYGASYGQTLTKLRLPAALPFIFNGLKINSTLALIGAIVAEFFGTPIVGIGFRISTEIGRMSIDMVWATILVAALFGSAFYWLLSLAERRVTFWHASYRGRT